MEYRWCVEELPAGLPVAQGSAANQDEATREVMRYANQYAQDGRIRFWLRAGRKTLILGTLAHRKQKE